MKGKIQKIIFLTIVFLIAVATIIGTKVVQAGKTGNSAYFLKTPDSMKIGNFHTYARNSRYNQDLDLYCAQKGSSITSHTTYLYDEYTWTSDAGIWKNEESFKKITWIKNNFWEANDASSDKKYTTAQKVKFLQQADSSIDSTIVESVFNSSSEKFKLYQMITWTYTNGRESAPTSLLSTNTRKVYTAIIDLANKNYTNYDKTQYIELTSNGTPTYSNGTYTWSVTEDSLCFFPIEYVLKVDGNEYKNYTYKNNKLTITGLEEGKYEFSFSATSATYYQISSTASVWKSSSAQNLIEVTRTEKTPVTDTATVTSEEPTEGYFSLNIKKVDEEGNAIQNAEFSVEGKDSINPTNSNGITVIEDKKEIENEKQTYSYTITEVSVGEKYVGLANPITIKLKSGTRKSGDKAIYAITQARFEESNGSTLETVLKDGSPVTLSLSLSISGDVTTVTVTIPNKEKIYDLALTKSIVIPNTDLVEKYDIDFSGTIDASDVSLIMGFYGNYQVRLYAKYYDKTIEDGAYYIEDEVVEEAVELLGITKDYAKGILGFLRNEINNEYARECYNYLNATSAIEKMMNLDTDGDKHLDLNELSSNLLSIYVKIGVGSDIDRLNFVNSTKLNTTEENTTATYNLNKSTYGVRKSDIIAYKITVYNEGNYDAENVKVTDYLPEGLVACDSEGNTVSEGTLTVKKGSKEYVWNISGNTATTEISNKISAYDGASLSKEVVYITCKLEDDVSVGDIFYNVAEISDSTPVDSNGNEVTGVKDRDSEENSLSTESNITDKYKEKFNSLVEDEESYNVSKDKYNYQDDDDFERIVIIPDTQFDLSLRKSITKIGKSESTMETYTKDVEDDDGNITKEDRLAKITEQSVNTCAQKGTGEYYHGKEVITIESDDYVEYTIRVYNEGAKGDLSGYAKQVTDYLPDGLEFHAIVDADGKWITSATSGKYVTTSNNFGYYEATYDETNNKIVIDCIDTPVLQNKNSLGTIKDIDTEKVQSYYNDSGKLNYIAYCYQEIKIICKVSSTAKANTNLTNIAEITSSVAVDGSVKDKDSVAGTITIADTTDKNAQKVNLSTYYEDVDVDDTYNTYYPGLEDDDDFETVKIETVPGTFDIELIKYVSGTKEPLSGAVFTIKIENGETTIYNKEGLKTGANGKLEKSITGLPISKEGETFKVTVIETSAPVGYTGVSEITFNATSVLSENKDTYVLKTENPTIENGLANVEITSNNIKIEIDNTPQEADLALRKFITAVDGVELTGEDSRVPSVDLANLIDGTSSTADYHHEKAPVLVANGQIVTYTIRIFNEGSMDVYASLIKDDIPEGLEFVQYTEGDGSINDIYRWKLVDENDNEVTDISKAKYIITDYLAKDDAEANLLKAFDPDTMDELDYRDVQVEFKVTEPNTSDRILTNYAQISEETKKEHQ